MCRDHVAPANSAWVVVGVLVQKSIGSTSQGAPYSRWKLSDLAGSDTWVALFGNAHKEHYAEVGCGSMVCCVGLR
jgi:tRNA G46 methylase TrmB